MYQKNIQGRFGEGRCLKQLWYELNGYWSYQQIDSHAGKLSCKDGSWLVLFNAGSISRSQPKVCVCHVIATTFFYARFCFSFVDAFLLWSQVSCVKWLCMHVVRNMSIVIVSCTCLMHVDGGRILTDPIQARFWAFLVQDVDKECFCTWARLGCLITRWLDVSNAKTWAHGIIRQEEQVGSTLHRPVFSYVDFILWGNRRKKFIRKIYHMQRKRKKS